MREYATRLRDLRTDRELSQAQIAIILGTTKNQVGKYERHDQQHPMRHQRTSPNDYDDSAAYILRLPKGRPHGFSKTT